MKKTTAIIYLVLSAITFTAGMLLMIGPLLSPATFKNLVATKIIKYYAVSLVPTLTGFIGIYKLALKPPRAKSENIPSQTT